MSAVAVQRLLRLGNMTLLKVPDVSFGLCRWFGFARTATLQAFERAFR